MYELHIMKDKLCPFIFRSFTVDVTLRHNWHKNIEILYVTGGSGFVKCDRVEVPMQEGDIIVINSNVIHRTYSAGKNPVSYHCLIIDEGFCRENGIDTAQYRFQVKIRDEGLKQAFLKVAEAAATQLDTLTYAPGFRSAVLLFLIALCENHISGKISESESGNSSVNSVKRALDYINKNYARSITLDDIADFAGISKFYLAREFKKYTGHTLFEYVNGIRCKNAELCIAQGMTVSKAAMESGFENLSYFSKIYKKIIGTLPSKSKSV